ncbi:cytochrome P450 [Couchioplanes caeruleus]|uniref:cytochrome P450 n=1 Tax=Couchioplanes caeruleus TaxID=56438 RepID=UPI00201BEB80|nr:cytochrome P450 [Couchioplanes caeruleus]UQU67706.1 cytochrome P450 [Couchioplanes caeruleus]
MTSDVALPAGRLVFPFARTDVLRPDPIYRRLRAERPVARVTMANGVGAYLVTRYADVRVVLEDARFSRAALSRTAPGELVAYAPPAVPASTEDGHSMPYELVNRWFTARAVERLRPGTARIADELLDRLVATGPPADLVAAYTAVLPMTVIGELAGIPAADRPRLRDLAPLVTVDSPGAQSRAASATVFQYFRTALEQRRRVPADDLLGALVTAGHRRAGMRPERLATLAMRACLPAMHSVSVVLSKAVPILLRQPEVYAAVRVDDGLTAPVVEELLRLTTPASAALPRLARCDVELSGGTVPEGAVAVASLESANSDEEHYPDPERIVAGRGAADHTTFGRGSNFCLGAALARMEVQVAVAALARRLPGLALAVPESELPVRTGVIAPDVTALPVRW